MTANSNERSLSTEWGFEPHWTACERCGWSYLIPANHQLTSCPHCFAAALSPVEDVFEAGQEESSRVRPPEQYLPFTLSEAELSQGIQAFSKGIPFASPELNPVNLKGRLQRLYLPLWLVDVDVQATWNAEAGFDYQVVSHKDRFDDHSAGWVSQEVKEGRVRWEPRRGSLKRSYTNIPAPALEDEPRLRRSLGDWALEQAQPYRAEAVEGAFIRLPDRIPNDAWQEAVSVIQAVAAEECRQAARANYQREFRWNPQFPCRNWTLLLRPVITTYYLDDEGLPQRILIHGQTGKVNGQRRASVKRGRRYALITFGVALVIFLVSLALTAFSAVFPPLLPFGGLGLLLAFLIALGAIFPVFQVWQFNRSQDQNSKRLDI